MTTIRRVINYLGFTLLASVGGIIGLAAFDRPIPDVLQNIAVGALASMGTLLVPTRSNDQPDPHD